MIVQLEKSVQEKGLQTQGWLNPFKCTKVSRTSKYSCYNIGPQRNMPPTQKNKHMVDWYPVVSWKTDRDHNEGVGWSLCAHVSRKHRNKHVNANDHWQTVAESQMQIGFCIYFTDCIPKHCRETASLRHSVQWLQSWHDKRAKSNSNKCRLTIWRC